VFFFLFVKGWVVWGFIERGMIQPFKQYYEFTLKTFNFISEIATTFN